MDELGQPILGSSKVETVPFAAYEAQAERNVRTIKYMVLGWVITVISLCLVLLLSMSYSDEVVETTETQTLERVAQADNQANAIVGDGDIQIGNSENNTDSNENNDN